MTAYELVGWLFYNDASRQKGEDARWAEQRLWVESLLAGSLQSTDHLKSMELECLLVGSLYHKSIRVHMQQY